MEINFQLKLKKQIQEGIRELANKLNNVYKNEELYLICVLKGSVMFTVDLAKHLKMIHRTETVQRYTAAA